MLPVPDYAQLMGQAAADRRTCVVGALVVNRDGHVFVHRRGWQRRLLPGCWDIVGGHVEPGENLLAALEREIAEETGWQLRGAPQLICVSDWQTDSDGQPLLRREFDFLVEVDGDLTQPRLEFPKHIEFRWIGPRDLGLLDENRGADAGLVRRLVELALRATWPWNTQGDGSQQRRDQTLGVRWAHAAMIWSAISSALRRTQRSCVLMAVHVLMFGWRSGRLRSKCDRSHWSKW